MTIMGHQKCINVVRVSPNDKLIASGSNDRVIKLWDANSLTQKGELKGHKKGVWDLQFSPVDQLLVSASGDMILKVWNTGTKMCIASL